MLGFPALCWVSPPYVGFPRPMLGFPALCWVSPPMLGSPPPLLDFPLLIFTDPVGLEDVSQDTETIIQELIGDLQQETNKARVLIITVKINDFATDTLQQIMLILK